MRHKSVDFGYFLRYNDTSFSARRQVVKISDVLSDGKINISFELFPPKDGEVLQKADEIITRVAALKPSFISVTCGAAGGNRRDTAAIAAMGARRGVNALAHMTCVAATFDSVADDLKRLEHYGVSNIMALRGDIVGDAKPGDFKHASDLTAFIKRHGDFCIGGACYPEGHPESPSIDRDIQNLKYKLDAGTEFLITQMFFDNVLLYRYLEMLQKNGINVPIVAGIMPVTSASQFERITSLSGGTLPQKLIDAAQKFKDDRMAMRSAGIEFARDQINDLVAHGVRNIHVYTMNKPEIAEAVYDGIRF